MSALAIALALSLSAADGEPVVETISWGDQATNKKATHPVPPWLPRSAALGLTAREGMWSMHLRLHWEIGLYERNGHDLVLIPLLGTGFSLSTPQGMTAQYQHVALLGFGYRKVSKLINWGFNWGIGVNWYRTAYVYTPLESRVVGYTEGRAQLGVRVAKNVVLGGYFGYGSPLQFDARYPGLTYTGGIMFGLFVDWR